MSTTPKYVYSFGGGKADGKADMKDLLGGKGANLAEMSSIGIPVPPGFTITTEVCADYYETGKKLPEAVKPQVEAALKQVESQLGQEVRRPGRPAARLRPLRRGAVDARHDEHDPQPRPDRRLGRGAGQEDRQPPLRLRQLSPPHRHVRLDGDGRRARALRARARTRSRRRRSVKLDTDLSADDLKELVKRYKAVYKKHVGEDFPQDPKDQLWLAIMAVFNSWMGNKAVEYRRIERITGLKGTAVNVQAMVFGNMGDNSGTGVAFTRDPNTGENVFYGDYLINAQGEDVVAGIRTPEPISQLDERDAQGLRAVAGDPQEARDALQGDAGHRVHGRGRQALHAPDPHRQADRHRGRADRRRDGQGRADRRDDGRQAGQPRQPQPPAPAAARPQGEGQAGRPGDRRQPRRGVAARWSSRPRPPSSTPRSIPNEPILLVRKETSPEDVAGMHLAKGILTATGGKASHAAVVARGWGKPCVVGCEAIQIDEKAGTDHDRRPDRQGRRLPHDRRHDRRRHDRQGADRRPRRSPATSPRSWPGPTRSARSRSAPTPTRPTDAAKAREFGAEGIGLCRTEHMFFGERADRRHAEDDPRRRRGGPQGRPRRARAVPAARTSSASSRRWTACRSPSACSTRRCTSSCRTTTKGQAEVAKQLGVPVEKVKRPRRAAPRVQPDARPPRLPPADRLPRDRRHAGPGDHRGGHRGQEAGQERPARDHDPAGRHRRGAGLPQEAGHRRRRGGA